MPSVASGQPDFQGFSICMIVFTTIFVGLRLWSRALSKEAARRFWWDDWLMILAWILCIVATSLHIYMLAIGLGKHITELTAFEVIRLLKVLWASYFVDDFGLMLSKASVLLFYARIFTTHKLWFRLGLWVCHILNLGWYLSGVARCLLFCSPVSKFWDAEIPGFCRNAGSLYIGSAVPSVTMDLFILLLPIPMIYQLSLKTGRKLLVVATFLCGYAVIGISIGRLIVSITSGQKLNEDLTYNAIPLLFLVDAELPLSIIGGCFPTCFYLARRWMKYGAASMFSINTPSTQPNYRVDRQYSPSNRRLRPGYESFSMETKSSDTKPSVYTGSDTQFDVAATRSAPDSDAGVGDDRHLQGIMVSNDFQVVSSDKL